jgi:hypothetical protein
MLMGVGALSDDSGDVAIEMVAERSHKRFRGNQLSWGFAFAGSNHTLEFSIVKLIDYEPKIDELLTLNMPQVLLTCRLHYCNG